MIATEKKVHDLTKHTNVSPKKSIFVALLRKHGVTITVGCLIILLASFYVYWSASTFPAITHEWILNNSYIGSDIPRVWNNLVDAGSNHARTKVHPLFSILICLPSIVAVKIGYSETVAVSTLLAINTIALIGLLYYLLFFVTRRTVDTLIFTMLFLASGSFIFWSKIPETHPFSATSVLIPFILLTLPNLKNKEQWILVGSVASVSLLVTNWTSGLISSAMSLGIKKTICIAVKTLTITAAIWSLQKFFFPSAGFFLDLSEEKNYIQSGGEFSQLRIFFLDSFSPLGVTQNFSATLQRPVVLLASNIDNFITPQLIFVWLAWPWILLAGLWNSIKEIKELLIVRAIILFLLCEVALHSFYGSNESFMYSLNWMPLLIVISSFASRGRLRLLVLGVAVLLTTVSIPRNMTLDSETKSILNSFSGFVAERQSLKQKN